MSTVDSLDIQISTSLKDTDKMLDNLIAKLGVVSSSLSNIGGASSTASGGMTKISNAATKSTKTFKGLSSAIGKFYANYFWVARGIKTLYKSIEGTADYIEAFNYFEVSFNKIANDWSKDYKKYGYENAKSYAESFSKRAKESLSKLSGAQVDVDADGKGLLTETGLKNLGLNIQEITQYASQLASITNSVGQTGEVSLATANAFTKLAGDISSLFNQDYSSVAKNLQSGLIGQSRALYKYGIDITNATLQTYAYELGLEKAVSEMTQAEKMQLRMIAILDQSKVSWGDLANTINSPSNMIRQFKNNLKEAGMVLGQLFIPLLQRVLPVVNGATIAIKRLLTNIAGILGIELDLSSFGQTGTDLEDSYGGVSDSLDDVAESAKKAKAGLRGFDELKTIQTPKNSSDGLGNTIDLTNEIIAATEEYEKVWQQAYDKMEQKAQAFADNIEKYFAPVKKLFKDIAIGDWFAVGQDTSNLVSGIFDFFSDAIESVDWEQVGTNIGLFLAGIDWMQILTSAFRLYRNLKDALMTVLKNSFEEAPMETFMIIAGIILGRLGTAIGMKTLTISLKNVVISGIGKITFNSWLKKHFSTQLAGLLPGTASNPVTLSSIVLNIAGFILGPFGVGTPVFDVFADNLLTKISGSINRKVPQWAKDLWNDIGIGLGTGALAGSWIPGVGTAVGALVGGIVGALEGIEIKGDTLFNKIFSPFFNFDYSKSVFKSSGKFFKDVKKTFENEDWLGVGKNIVGGIGNGIWGGLSFLVEPIGDLLTFTSDTICDVFGINSPAKEMEPFGVYILRGIISGFISGFPDMKKTINNFFEKIVSPSFSSKKWSEKTGSIKDAIKEKWNAAMSWWKDNAKLPKINIAFVFSTDSVKKAINTIIGWINKYIIDSLNKISVKIPEIKVLGQTLYKGEVFGFDIKKIATFETGGFPKSADLFWANENGVPELVGTMGGKTAVAGGMEITGIKDAIYSTGQKESALMQTMVGLLKIIAEKEFGITDTEIGKSAQRYAKEYFNRTGNEAYIF